MLTVVSSQQSIYLALQSNPLSHSSVDVIGMISPKASVSFTSYMYNPTFRMDLKVWRVRETILRLAERDQLWRMWRRGRGEDEGVRRKEDEERDGEGSSYLRTASQTFSHLRTARPSFSPSSSFNLLREKIVKLNLKPNP